MIWSNRALKVWHLETPFGKCDSIPLGTRGGLCGIDILNIKFPVKEGQILDGNSISAVQDDKEFINIINKDVGLSLLISTRSNYDERLAHGAIEVLKGKESLKMLSRGYGNNNINDFRTDLHDCWFEYLLLVTGDAAIAVRKSGVKDEHEAWYIILIQNFTVEYMKKDDVVKYFDKINRSLPEWVN